MKKLITIIAALFCFATVAVAAESPSDSRYDNGQLESFGCCSLPQ
jgi:hypothetical protein